VIDANLEITTGGQIVRRIKSGNMAWRWHDFLQLTDPTPHRCECMKLASYKPILRGVLLKYEEITSHQSKFDDCRHIAAKFRGR